MINRVRNMEWGGLLHPLEHFEDLKFDSDFGDPLALGSGLGLDPEGIGLDVGTELPLSDDVGEADFLESWFNPGAFETEAVEAAEAEGTAAALDFFNDGKTDCMWGMGRKRDLSLTLADLFDFRDDRGSDGQDGVFGEPPCAALPDPVGQIFGLMEDNVSHDEEHPDPKRPALARQVSTLVHRNLPHIEAGRSLLLASHRRPGTEGTASPHQTFLDHSYFSPSPVKSWTPGTPVTPGGLLTPNETSCSEDDDAIVKTKTSRSSISPAIDKKKIAQAVQSLIKKNPHDTSHPVKFRFRMKFEPSVSGATSHTKATNCSSSGRRQCRTSTLPNPPCPSPAKKSNTNPKTNKSDSKFEDSRLEALEMRGSKTCIEYRKVRDLHNSMERQRRVNLRHSFDLLKSAIPDLAINGKASNLNILEQGTLYCKKLHKLHNRMKKSESAERARNMILKKKLQQLESQFHARRPSARQIKPKRLE